LIVYWKSINSINRSHNSIRWRLKMQFEEAFLKVMENLNAKHLWGFWQWKVIETKSDSFRSFLMIHSFSEQLWPILDVNLKDPQSSRPMNSIYIEFEIGNFQFIIPSRQLKLWFIGEENQCCTNYDHHKPKHFQMDLKWNLMKL
jgi:hypothetical protein